VLFGDRLLYYLLAAFDPELGEHFKLLADFDDDVDRSPASEAVLARLIASMLRHDGLRPMARNGVALLIEHGARLAEDAGKLTMIVEHVHDLIVEADFRAGNAGRALIARDDVDQTIAERVRRAARLRDRMQEMIVDKIALIETSGTRVGQINGLSIIELGGFVFGRPTRISCQVRSGSGQLVDIEREVELGGPIHSKGVLILSGFLAGRYALDTPLSLQASLVFEQSYSGVEGDSASSAELYVLMSALAELPLRQDLAVTGSVNQHGEIQAIGGVNEKIEGFFDTCKARGLTGSQGVIIPQANVCHLMLRRDVIEACGAGRFAIYAVSTIEEGLALMTGRAAGQRDPDGAYPEGRVNRLIDDRLRAFAAVKQNFVREGQATAAEERKL
jgi:predicted ATP-dependent protease